MKISGLDTKQYIPGVDPTGETSYLVVNCLAEVYNAETAITETKPLTYKVSLDELGKMLITTKNIVTYNNKDNENNPVKELKTVGTENSNYVVEAVGQYIDANDRATLNNVQLGYADNSYPETDPETVNWNKYYVKGVTSSNGTITAEHALLNPSITWSLAENADTPTIKISVGGNEATPTTPNAASTSVYGITKLYDGTDSTSTVLAATANSVKSALDAASTDAGNQIAALDVTNNTEDTHYITGFSAAKTLSTLTQTDGLISASFQDIAIPESAVTNLTADLAEKAPLFSPRFRGSIRLGDTGATLGSYTISAGHSGGSANVQSSLLCGDYLSANGNWSSILGYNLGSVGTCIHVVGKYNESDIMDTWHSSQHYYVGDMVQTLQHHVTGQSGNILYFKCIEENTDVSFIDSKWERLNLITGKFVEMVGNGTNGANCSNARAVDWNGNEYLNGNLYVTCDYSSKNGKKVATEEYVDAKVPNPPTTNGTYNLQVVINNNTATYSWEAVN